jgi:NAD(P)-dependent dehydrogenase (short-subunit alcohol dehydrogenase family)
MTDSLNEKVAIVTGGGSGIGEGLCRELARRGARVVVADINSAEAERVAVSITGSITVSITGSITGLGGQATASTVDVSRPEQVTGLAEETAAAHGRLDYMFNNAGFAIGGDFRDLTLDHWHRVLDVDLYGVLHGMQAAYPIMIRQGFGHIVNTSSAAAFFAAPGNAPYCTAKYALVGLSLSLRLEGIDLGVKVSCVCPGFVRTNVYRNAEAAGMTLPAGVPREQVAGAPAKMMAPERAARVILDGVARNKALIVFPAAIRWGRRLDRLVPGLSDKLLLREMRALRRYRTADARVPG